MRCPPPGPHTPDDTSTRAVLADIDQSLEDHYRLAAPVAFDRLFDGWDDDDNDAWSEYWASCRPTEEIGSLDGASATASSSDQGQLDLSILTGGTPPPRRFTGAQHQPASNDSDDMAVVEPPFELTFTLALDNLDAAAYQEAHQDSPFLTRMPYEDQHQALSEVLDDQAPEHFEFYEQQVQHYRAQLGLAPRACRTAPPTWVQGTFFPQPSRRHFRPPSCS